MLQHHTMGYSLWTVQDKPMNVLRNGLFERDYPCWQLEQTAIVFDEASQQHAAQLAPKGRLSQAVIGTEDELVIWPDKGFTLRFQINSPGDTIQLCVQLRRDGKKQAHWQETVTQTVTANTWHSLHLTPSEFLMGDTFVVENQGQAEVLLTGFYLYQFCQESGVLDANGNPKPFYEAFMAFQTTMR
jgi:hypothetical protein